jgi:hypothetical protein
MAGVCRPARRSGVAKPTELLSFFYTHNKTLSGLADEEGDRLRMRMMLLCTTTVRSGGQDDNLGGVTIQSMKIEEILQPF